MSDPGRTGELSMALFLAGVVAFSPPLLFIFGSPDAALFGIPLIYIYLFAVWIALVALGALVAERAERQPSDADETRHGDPPPPPERRRA